MDANVAQTVVVWAALSIGLACVVYCVFSASASLPQSQAQKADVPGSELEPSLDVENTA